MLAKGGSRRERKGGGIVELDLERRFNEPTAALISAGEVFKEVSMKGSNFGRESGKEEGR